MARGLDSSFVTNVRVADVRFSQFGLQGNMQTVGGSQIQTGSSDAVGSTSDMAISSTARYLEAAYNCTLRVDMLQQSQVLLARREMVHTAS